MLFVGLSWPLMICVGGLQVLPHLWDAVWFVVCSTWTLVWPEIHSTVGFLRPSLYHVLPCRVLRSLSHPIKMAQAWLTSSAQWTHGSGSLPFQMQASLAVFFSSHLYLRLLYSPVGGKHQSLCSHTPPSSRASTSHAPENNFTIFFSREPSISAA